MPAWLKCHSCGRKYYTSENLFELQKKENICDYCGDELQPIYPDPKAVLQENLEVEVVFLQNGDLKSLAAEIEDLGEEKIELSLLEDDKIPRGRAKDNCLIKFRNEKALPGYFRFETEVLECEDEKEAELVAELPDFTEVRQERRDPRFTFEEEVKIYADDENEFITVHSRDLSLRGIALMVPRSVQEEKFGKGDSILLELQYHKFHLSVQGRIVRRQYEKEDEKKYENDCEAETVLLGIQFENLDEEKKRLLKRIQARRLAVR